MKTEKFKKGSELAAISIASVWFSTHFGGGFSSGRQIVQFYTRFGAYAIFMPIVAVAIMALVYYFAVSYAVANKTFDYRSWALGYYKPWEKIGAILYEICYVLILLTATAVVFATGGSLLKQLFHIPYLPSTIIVALLIFVIAIFGADAVRKFSVVMALTIIAVWIVIYSGAIIKNPSAVSTVIHGAGSLRNYSFWKALWNAILYAGFQSTLIASWVSVADTLETKKATAKAFLLYGFIINAAMLTLASIGILGFYPAVLKETLPSIYVASHGFSSNAAFILGSTVILLACISTGVPIVYGGVKRIVSALPKTIKGSETKKNIIPTAGYLLITWAIAQFGLIPLIAKGYGTIGYIAIFVIIIPVLIKGFIDSRKWKTTKEKE